MSIFLGDRKQQETKKSVSIDTTKFLKKDGSDAMLGNLDLGNFAIENLKTYPENNKQATSKKYVDDETAKLLDLDANRQMKGDLSMGDNSIIGIYDISADNSVPSKKFVKDELAKKESKTTVATNTANIATNSSEISLLKAKKLFSHYSYFLYSNPVQGVYKDPFLYPAGFLDQDFFLSGDYDENTRLNIISVACDSDSTLPTSNVLMSIEGIFYTGSEGFNSKVFLSGKNILPYKMGGSNKFHFGNDLSFVIKDFHNSWASWKSFKLKVAVPWSGNETGLWFSVTYY